MADDFLSQDEVDALLQGVDDEVSLDVDTKVESTQNANQASSNGSQAQNHASCTLASFEGIGRGRLPKLETMHDRFCGFYQTSVEKLLGRSAEVLISSVKQSRYDDFIKGLTFPASINLARIKPLKGTALFILESDLIFLMVDQLFGGQGRPNKSSESREFTPTEHRIIQRILVDLLANYSRAWAPVYPIDIEIFRSESHARFVKVINPNDIVLTATLTIHFGSATGQLHLCLPSSMIEPIRTLLGSEAETSPEVDKRWQQRMSRQLQSAEVELVARLGEINVTLGDLMKMQPGDFIPFEMPEIIPVHVDDVAVMTGSYGTSNHQYALRVESLVALSSGSPS